MTGSLEQLIYLMRQYFLCDLKTFSIEEEFAFYQLFDGPDKEKYKRVLLGHFKQLIEEKKKGDNMETHKLFVRMAVFSPEFDKVKYDS